MISMSGSEIITIIASKALENLEMSKSFATNVTIANAYAIAATLVDIADSASDMPMHVAWAIAGCEYSTELCAELITMMEHERVTAYYIALESDSFLVR